MGSNGVHTHRERGRMAENKEETEDQTTKILQSMFDRNYNQGGQDVCESLITAFEELKSQGQEFLNIDRVIYLIEGSRELVELRNNASR